MKSVHLIGGNWCQDSKDALILTTDVCNKLGYTVQYEDIEVSEYAQHIFKSQFFRKLPALVTINYDEVPVKARYKVGGFDEKSVLSFLKDEKYY
tara:strand:- start:3112 stop:3393 length:282 start_codon:yes stop_codon:yes gene_type:complete